MADPFADVLDANRRYANSFAQSGLTGRAARELAVLTCIDSRIEPLAMLGLQPGDAKIIRNAGARVTDDALRSLVLAANLLNARRIMVVTHTDCAMTKTTDEDLRSTFEGRFPVADLEGMAFHSTLTPHETLASDVSRLRRCGLILPEVEIGGFEYNVHTGEIHQIVP